jgi:hydrogenase maturation protein HypF
MLPYTPLHHLILNQTDLILGTEPAPSLLVMTSGNFSEEPIATDNEDALHKLSPLADAFLLHNRDIHMRCDDSVVRVDHRPLTIDQQPVDVVHRPSSALAPGTDSPRVQVSGRAGVVYFRRSRGYAPYSIELPSDIKPTLAVGGELKNTFCLARGRHAFISHYIGDMENAETFEAFEKGIEHLSHIFHVQPEIIAYDLHPNYHSTQYARRLSTSQVGVQHHHAHIVSCMVDNGLDDRRLIGLAFDGTGYGADGAIWGGEVLLASFADFERFAHLEYLPLPGGDSAIRAPWRVAAAYAHALHIDVDDLPFLQHVDHESLHALRQQINKYINTAHTSSMGRLFDAVASLIGLRNQVTYEAQAAMELEVLAKPFVLAAQPYPYAIDDQRTIQLKDLLSTIVQDVRARKSIEIIAARFHRTIATIAIDICKQARQLTGLNEVALSGGVWQNEILLNLVRDGLKRDEFVVYSHRQVPTNDGGLSLGQAVIANYSHGEQKPASLITDGQAV